MLSPTLRRGQRAPAILLSVLMLGVLAACGGAASAPVGGEGAGPGFLDNAGGDAPAPGALDGGGSQADRSGDRVYSAAQQDLLIIKTGDLVIQVGGIDTAVDAATRQIDALGGYVSGSQRSGDGDDANATVTFRIPATRWDEALAALRAVGDKVLRERTQTEDVTGQVVDLGARITNLRATEAALQDIMSRATAIKDVLAVQEQLTQVRGQIEQLTAQKSHLEEQASFSTLSVTFSLKPDPVLTEQNRFDPSNEVDRASASLVGVLQAIATAGIWFGIVWLPILVALAIVAGLGALVLRRFRRGTAAAAVDPPAAPPATA